MQLLGERFVSSQPLILRGAPYILNSSNTQSIDKDISISYRKIECSLKMPDIKPSIHREYQKVCVEADSFCSRYGLFKKSGAGSDLGKLYSMVHHDLDKDKVLAETKWACYIFSLDNILDKDGDIRKFEGVALKDSVSDIKTECLVSAKREALSGLTPFIYRDKEGFIDSYKKYALSNAMAKSFLVGSSSFDSFLKTRVLSAGCEHAIKTKELLNGHKANDTDLDVRKKELAYKIIAMQNCLFSLKKEVLEWSDENSVIQFSGKRTPSTKDVNKYCAFVNDVMQEYLTTSCSEDVKKICDDWIIGHFYWVNGFNNISGSLRYS